MSVRKRVIRTQTGTTNRWEASVMLGNGKRLRKLFKGKAEAVQFEAQTLSNVAKGSHRAGGDKTVQEHFDEFFAHVEGRHRRGEIVRGYVVQIRGHIRNYICADTNTPQTKHDRATYFTEGIGSLRLREVRRGLVEDFRDALRDAGVSVQITRAVLRTMHIGFERALARDLLVANPAHRVRVTGPRNEKAKIKPPSPQIVESLIEGADDDFAVVVHFAAVTGLRAGEQAALRWRHIELDGRRVRVETRVDGYGQEDGQGTKSVSGNRTVPFGRPLAARLTAWRARTPFPNDDDLVFPNSVGNFQHHGSKLVRLWYPLLDEVLSEKERSQYPLNWHSLRHFAVSTWIANKVDWKKIQTWVGHSDFGFTMTRYGHIFEDGIASDATKAAIERLTGSNAMAQY